MPDETLTAALAGENEVPAVATMASGDVTATLTGSTLVVDGSFEGLMSDLVVIAGSSAHIHQAAAGANGAVLFSLDVTSTDQRSGTLSGEFELTEQQRADFLAGLYYVNVHTVGNGSGELRAQLIDDAPAFAAVERVFDGLLLGDNEVPPVVTVASGTATGVLRTDGMVTVSGNFTSLESTLFDVADFGPAHVHEGVAGTNGGVVFMLDVAANDAMTAGRFGASEMFTALQVDDLLMGGFYVNVHTQVNQGGGVRGQLFPTDVEASTTLTGGAEVPTPVVTAASGEATATASGFTLSLVGTFTGLESDLQDVSPELGSAHIHAADVDANGPVVFALGVSTADQRSGTLALTDEELSEQQRADFVAGFFYVNIHTVDNGGGEIRGQLEPF